MGKLWTQQTTNANEQQKKHTTQAYRTIVRWRRRAIQSRAAKRTTRRPNGRRSARTANLTGYLHSTRRNSEQAETAMNKRVLRRTTPKRNRQRAHYDTRRRRNAKQTKPNEGATNAFDEEQNLTQTNNGRIMRKISKSNKWATYKPERHAAKGTTYKTKLIPAHS